MNLKKLAERTQAVEKNVISKGGLTFWKPIEGDNHIRVMPGKEGTDGFAEGLVHWINGVPIECELEDADNDGSCVICECSGGMIDSGSEEMKKKGEEIKQKREFVVGVIDRKQERRDGEAKLQAWNTGSKLIIDAILNGLDLNPGILDPHTGRDLQFTQGKNKQYSGIKFAPQCPIADDNQTISVLMESQYDFGEFQKKRKRTREQIMELLRADKYINAFIDSL